MATNDTRSSRARLASGSALLALWALLLVVSAAPARRPALSGCLFVLLAASALSLAGFTAADGVRALREARASTGSARSALFWEAAARNAWLSGVLGCVLYFVLALCTSEGGLAAVATAMALAFVPAVCGLALAMLCLLPVMKLRHHAAAAGRDEPTTDTAEPPAATPSARDHALGHVLFFVLLAVTIGWRYGTAVEPLFPVWAWLLNWPALVVIALAVVAVTVLGAPLRARAWTAAFGFAGLLGALFGVVRVLTGFAARDLASLTAGLSFVVSSCFVAMLALAVVAGPTLDRAARGGAVSRPSTLERLVWALYPGVVLIFVALALLATLTPMTAPAP